MIVVIGRVRCPEERREELQAAAERMQAESRKEDGCLRYEFYTAIADPLSFVAVEEWEDRDALERHFGQPHFQEFVQRLGEAVSEPPEIAIHEVAHTQPFGRHGAT